MAQNVESDETEFCIRGTTEKTEITFAIDVWDLQVGSKVISPDFHLAPECLAYVAFEKLKNFVNVSLCNTSVEEIKIQRRIVLHVSNVRHVKVHEERNGDIYSLRKGREQAVIGDLDRKVIDYKKKLIIKLWVTIKEIAGHEIHRFLCHSDPVRKLRDDLKNLLENPTSSDVTLLVGNDQIPAHWSILCSRSSYFKNLYENQMKKKAQNSVTISDFSISAVKKVIRFLYTADFVEEGHLQEFLDLYPAADMFDLKDLRALCARQIMSNATVDNASQILLLAQRHFDEDFKKQVVDFILLHFDAVSQTNGWKTFEESEPVAAGFFGLLRTKRN